MKISTASRWLLGLFSLSMLLALLGYGNYYSRLGPSGTESRSSWAPTAVIGVSGQIIGSLAPSSPADSPRSEVSALAAAMTGSTDPTPISAAGLAEQRLPAAQRRPPAAAQTQAAELVEFSRRVVNGKAGALCGVYDAGVLALRVVQQPEGDAAFISDEDGTATQFQKADSYGAVGLLAHNTLAGRDFFKITAGQELILIECDGRAEPYRVAQIADYQRLTLGDLRSDFLSLDTNERQTADQVFDKFYQRPHQLTLQTCIRRGEEASWGVRFVVADHSQSSP